MNRALRRKLKLKYWYKRIKTFYRLGDKRIPCDNENELPAHEKKTLFDKYTSLERCRIMERFKN